VEIVDIFRRSEAVLSIVDEAIKIGARFVWIQGGVIHKAASARARDAALLVVMDKYMRKKHRCVNKGPYLKRGRQQ
jgi:predicted CoA-binding protein